MVQFEEIEAHTFYSARCRHRLCLTGGPLRLSYLSRLRLQLLPHHSWATLWLATALQLSHSSFSPSSPDCELGEFWYHLYHLPDCLQQPSQATPTTLPSPFTPVVLWALLAFHIPLPGPWPRKRTCCPRAGRILIGMLIALFRCTYLSHPVTLPYAPASTPMPCPCPCPSGAVEPQRPPRAI